MADEVLLELKTLLADVREKSGVDVRLTPGSGAETQISVNFCGIRTDVWIDGTGAGAERCARLVQYLVSEAEMHPVLPEKSEYLRNIMLGEGSGWYVYRFMTKYNLSDGECYAVEIMPDKLLPEALSLVESCLAETQDLIVQMDDNRIAVVKFLDSAQLPIEFGRFLSQSLLEELGVRAGIGIGGEVKSFSQIAFSYRQASTAVRMGGLFGSEGKVHAYREFMLVKMIEDISKDKMKEYIDQFCLKDAEEIFEDEEMTSTAEEFLENSLNISETSRNLFMHRNTLMYRLDKIERITGLNIRNFSDAVTFRVITILYKLTRL